MPNLYHLWFILGTPFYMGNVKEEKIMKTLPNTILSQLLATCLLVHHQRWPLSCPQPAKLPATPPHPLPSCCPALVSLCQSSKSYLKSFNQAEGGMWYGRLFLGLSMFCSKLVSLQSISCERNKISIKASTQWASEQDGITSCDWMESKGCHNLCWDDHLKAE